MNGIALGIVIGALAALVVLTILAILLADVDDDVSTAEQYAQLVRDKHDTASDILRDAAWCVEMSSLAGAQARTRSPRPRNSTDGVTVIDAEYSVQNVGQAS